MPSSLSAKYTQIIGSRTSTNYFSTYTGGHVNFDLCKDDGAAGALFGTTGIGMGIGHVVEVDCSAWGGSKTS